MLKFLLIPDQLSCTRINGVIELNKMSAIEDKLETIMNIINNQERRGYSCNEVGVVEGVG